MATPKNREVGVLNSKAKLSNMIAKQYGDKAPDFIQDMFFDTSDVTYAGVLKRWTGATWVKTNMKTYLAGSFQSKPLKIYKDGSWQLVDKN